MANEPQQPEAPFVNSDWAAVPDVHRFARQAMATTFEVVVQHEDRLYAQQAASAAFAELARIEGELSRYLETSDITRINHLPANQPLPIGLEAFECLAIGAEIHEQTGGAFDMTVGFLVDAWLDEDKKPRTPSDEELRFAREHTGMDLILLDEPTHAVALTKSPVRVDPGAIGKGYGVDRMAELLREWSIDRALIHGGFSTVLAMDAPHGAKGWPITLSDPANRQRTLARLELERIAVGASGVQKGQHIIDPRVARPIEGKIAAWSVAPDATRADALSTAFMVMPPREVQAYCREREGVRALLIVEEPTDRRIIAAGRWKQSELVVPTS